MLRVFKDILDLDDDSNIHKVCAHNGIECLDALLNLTVMETKGLMYELDDKSTTNIKMGTRVSIRTLKSLEYKRILDLNPIAEDWSNVTQEEYDDYRTSHEYYHACHAGLPIPQIPRPVPTNANDTEDGEQYKNGGATKVIEPSHVEAFQAAMIHTSETSGCLEEEEKEEEESKTMTTANNPIGTVATSTDLIILNSPSLADDTAIDCAVVDECSPGIPPEPDPMAMTLDPPDIPPEPDPPTMALDPPDIPPEPDPLTNFQMEDDFEDVPSPVFVSPVTNTTKEPPEEAPNIPSPVNLSLPSTTKIPTNKEAKRPRHAPAVEDSKAHIEYPDRTKFVSSMNQEQFEELESYNNIDHGESTSDELLNVPIREVGE